MQNFAGVFLKKSLFSGGATLQTESKEAVGERKRRADPTDPLS